METEEEFLEWYRGQVGIDKLAWLEPTGDGHWVSVERLLFHWTLKIGNIGDRNEYEDRWCYATLSGALEAVNAWRDRKYEDEPTGWRRHPNTGRRRNDDGDPASEEIRW